VLDLKGAIGVLHEAVADNFIQVVNVFGRGVQSAEFRQGNHVPILPINGAARFYKGGTEVYPCIADWQAGIVDRKRSAGVLDAVQASYAIRGVPNEGV
jgi:hypothetical protein